MRPIVIVKKIINALIPKRGDYIYANPHPNCDKDGYNLKNYTSDNLLCFIIYILTNYHGEHLKIIMESDEKSIAQNQKYIDDNFKNQSISIYLIQRPCKGQKWRRIMNDLKRYRSKTWWLDTIGNNYSDKVKSQKIVCFNYYIPFKNDFYLYACKFCDVYDTIVTSSLLASQIHISANGGRLDKYLIAGFPRNDIMVSHTNENVYKWLYSKCNESIKNVILYVPTFSEVMKEDGGKYLFGYDDGNELNDFLKKNNAYIVYKPHPWERVELSDNHTRIIKYPFSDEFSLYDIMHISSVLISNYSSVAHDFLLLDRPVIYNMPDLESYKDNRGLSYDPIDFVCGGPIVTTWEEMKSALQCAIDKPGQYQEKRNYVRNILFKYNDTKATERIYNHLFPNK